jgi:hypothetical protein
LAFIVVDILLCTPKTETKEYDMLIYNSPDLSSSFARLQNLAIPIQEI